MDDEDDESDETLAGDADVMSRSCDSYDVYERQNRSGLKEEIASGKRRSSFCFCRPLKRRNRARINKYRSFMWFLLVAGKENIDLMRNVTFMDIVFTLFESVFHCINSNLRTVQYVMLGLLAETCSSNRDVMIEILQLIRTQPK